MIDSILTKFLKFEIRNFLLLFAGVSSEDNKHAELDSSHNDYFISTDLSS